MSLQDLNNEILSETNRQRYPVADNALDIVLQGIDDPNFDPSKPYHGINPPVPEISFDIQMQTVTAAPRKLKALWSPGAVDDLRAMWGGSMKPDNALDIFTEGLDDPEFDPDKPYRGKKTQEDSLIDAMANEMKSEIDREIMKTLMP
jgi:hypothetical protein